MVVIKSGISVAYYPDCKKIVVLLPLLETGEKFRDDLGERELTIIAKVVELLTREEE